MQYFGDKDSNWLIAALPSSSCFHALRPLTALRSFVVSVNMMSGVSHIGGECGPGHVLQSGATGDDLGGAFLPAAGRQLWMQFWRPCTSFHTETWQNVGLGSNSHVEHGIMTRAVDWQPSMPAGVPILRRGHIAGSKQTRCLAPSTRTWRAHLFVHGEDNHHSTSCRALSLSRASSCSPCALT